jgi:hypothetical protein
LSIRSATDPDARDALTQHNQDILSLADQNPAAHAVLSDIYDEDPPAAATDVPADLAMMTKAVPEAVALPIGRSGNPDLALYLKRLGGALNDVCSPARLQDWIAVNEPIYLGDDIGPGTHAKALALLTACKRNLGMSMPE